MHRIVFKLIDTLTRYQQIVMQDFCSTYVDQIMSFSQRLKKYVTEKSQLSLSEHIQYCITQVNCIIDSQTTLYIIRFMGCTSNSYFVRYTNRKKRNPMPLLSKINAVYQYVLLYEYVSSMYPPIYLTSLHTIFKLSSQKSSPRS